MGSSTEFFPFEEDHHPPNTSANAMVKASVTALLLVASSLATALGYEADPPYGPRGQFLTRVRPMIGSTVFDVTSSKYGAVGDNRTDNTKAIQLALDDCAKSHDGGVVLLPNKASPNRAPPGPSTSEDGSVYKSYPLFLKDAAGCAIVLRHGATLFALPWSGPLPPLASTTLASAARQHRLGLGSSKVSFVNVDHCVSCAIGGGGTIDGNGPAWWPDKESKNRPKLISVSHSRDFALWNFTATDGGDHTIELGADDVEVAYMEIVMDWKKAMGLNGVQAPNTDGIDVHGTPFWVHHTHIDVGDDNVAVHASHVVVEDCHFGGPAFGTSVPHGHGASIGSIGSNTRLENITFRRIIFENTHVGPNIKVHGDAVDGYVRNVVYEDLQIDNAQLENMYIHCNYGDKSNGNKEDEKEEQQLPLRQEPTSSLRRTQGDPFVVSNILFKNITAKGTNQLGGFKCSKDVKCVNITMVDVHADSPRSHKSSDYFCENVTGSASDVDPPIPCLHKGGDVLV